MMAKIPTGTMDIRIDRTAARTYATSATAFVPHSADRAIRMHAEADCASTFRDVGHYTRFEKRGTFGNCVIDAEWPLHIPFSSAKNAVRIRKTVRGNDIAFQMVGGDDDDDPIFRVEGTWSFADLPYGGARATLEQETRCLKVPPFVPSFVVQRILRHKVRTAFQDMGSR